MADIGQVLAVPAVGKIRLDMRDGPFRGIHRPTAMVVAALPIYAHPDYGGCSTSSCRAALLLYGPRRRGRTGLSRRFRWCFSVRFSPCAGAKTRAGDTVPAGFFVVSTFSSDTFFKWSSMGVAGIFRHYAFHGRVRLYRVRIHCLGVSGHHPAVDTQGEYLVEQGHEQGFWVELPRPAYRRVPWQILVDVIAQKVEHVHPHTAVLHQFPVGGVVLKVLINSLKKTTGRSKGCRSCHRVPSCPCREISGQAFRGAFCKDFPLGSGPTSGS